jgi:hypothetical protein
VERADEARLEAPQPAGDLRPLLAVDGGDREAVGLLLPAILLLFPNDEFGSRVAAGVSAVDRRLFS